MFSISLLFILVVHIVATPIKVCSSGYWNSYNQICVDCESNCQICNQHGCLKWPAQQLASVINQGTSIRLLQHTCDNKCKTCVNSTCTQCKDGHAFQNGNGNCKKCDPSCVNCYFPHDNHNCSSCIAGKYLDANNFCVGCSAFGVQCRQCDNYGCTLCTAGYLVSGTGCITCPSLVCLTCNNITCLTCQQYYSIQNSICMDTCGDGHAITLPCDNQIGIAFDGCTDDCNVMQDFSCYVTSFTTICSFTGTLVMDIVQFIKQPYSNAFSFVISLYPPLHAFINTDLSQLFSINDTVFTVQNISYSNGNLTIAVSYKQNIANKTLWVKFIQSLSADLRFSLTPASNLQITIPAQIGYFYSQSILTISSFIRYYCLVLVILTWIVFFIAIPSNNLAGLQLMFVLQISWIMLLWLPGKLAFAYYMCQPLKYSMGLSVLQIDPYYTTQLAIQSKASKIDTRYFSNNFNIVIVLYLIPLLGAGIYKLFTYKSQYKDKAVRIYQKFLECLMYGTMYNLLGLTLYCFIFFACSDTKNNISSLFIISISLLITIGTFIKFHFDPDPFARFRYSFTITQIAMHYYYFYTAWLILSVLLLGFLSNIYWICFIPFGLHMLFTIFYMPYRVISENLRSFYYLLVTNLTIGLRLLYSLNDQDWRMSQIAIILLIVLLAGLYTIAVIWAYVEVIRSLCIPKRQAGKQKKQTIEYSLFQDNKLMQEMCADPSNFQKVTGVNPFNTKFDNEQFQKNIENHTDLDKSNQPDSKKFQQKEENSFNLQMAKDQIKDQINEVQQYQMSQIQSIKNEKIPKKFSFKPHEKSIFETLFSYDGTLIIQGNQGNSNSNNLGQRQQIIKQLNGSQQKQANKTYTKTQKGQVRKAIKKQLQYLKFKTAAELVKPRDQNLIQIYKAI